MTKACVDCKYFAPRRPARDLMDICRHPNSKSVNIDYVTGKEEVIYAYCANNRVLEGRCGREGRWFVSTFEDAKPSEPLVKKWWEFWK